MTRVPASFRDPSGFVFRRGKQLYRQINPLYQPHYARLMESGLYRRLVAAGLLIPHQEVESGRHPEKSAYRTIKPELVPFVSYPYEWCFSQLKDAALLTLQIQEMSLEHQMSLKDASAYNVQFRDGKPVWIDTLSFEKLQEGQPWVAYRQFCQHFLAPLALMAQADVRLNQLLRSFLDGIPVDLASPLLPRRSWLRPTLLIHLHLHALAQKHLSGKVAFARRQRVELQALRGLVDNLRSGIARLRWRPGRSTWSHYYRETSYTAAALEQKRQLVARHLDHIQPRTAWDLGANTGMFSRLAASRGIQTVSFDLDPAAVEENYRRLRSGRESKLLPLCMDLTNPSPALGWQNRERDSLLARSPADVVLALALVHHLAIGNNVPLEEIADFLEHLGGWLIVEFVPKSDPQVERLLATREDIFHRYTAAVFEASFKKHFTLEAADRIEGSERVLYRMKKRAQPEAGR